MYKKILTIYHFLR